MKENLHILLFSGWEMLYNFLLAAKQIFLSLFFYLRNKLFYYFAISANVYEFITFRAGTAQQMAFAGHESEHTARGGEFHGSAALLCRQTTNCACQRKTESLMQCQK